MSLVFQRCFAFVARWKFFTKMCKYVMCIIKLSRCNSVHEQRSAGRSCCTNLCLQNTSTTGTRRSIDGITWTFGGVVTFITTLVTRYRFYIRCFFSFSMILMANYGKWHFIIYGSYYLCVVAWILLPICQHVICLDNWFGVHILFH